MYTVFATVREGFAPSGGAKRHPAGGTRQNFEVLFFDIAPTGARRQALGAKKRGRSFRSGNCDLEGPPARALRIQTNLTRRKARGRAESKVQGLKAKLADICAYLRLFALNGGKSPIAGHRPDRGSVTRRNFAYRYVFEKLSASERAQSCGSQTRGPKSDQIQLKLMTRGEDPKT
jgi:hypothetical protein